MGENRTKNGRKMDKNRSKNWAAGSRVATGEPDSSPRAKSEKRRRAARITGGCQEHDNYIET
uniref:Uncharacterized protein n=1 Tax=Romanomermis culicivorax TaxID=13658 RepID=A0A915KP63_ROMCU